MMTAHKGRLVGETGTYRKKMFENNGSINHHYIPRFYLKGFCRNNGTFDVYDKKYAKFKKAPQSPAGVFFDPRRNNIKYRGQTTDVIESSYSAIVAQLFVVIQTGTPQEHILGPDGIRLLKTHMAFQFWRLPRLDGFADDYLKGLTREQVRRLCAITNPPLPAENIYDLLRSDDGFRKFARSFLLPLATFSLNGSIPEDMHWSILDFECGNKLAHHLCTDAPFIFDDPQGFMEFSVPFIFPLTNARVLVGRRRKGARLSLEPIVSTKISVLSYIQANRYVVTAERLYLEKIIEFSELYIGPSNTFRLQREVLSSLE
jgi:hypothetical protein